MKLKNLVSVVSALCVIGVSPVSAGGNYKLKYDKFDNKKVASYELSLGKECKLNQTSKSTLFSCPFISVSTEVLSPTLMLITYSNGWDIMTYRSVSPYSEKQAPVIITYKNGTKKNTKLPAIFSGDVVGSGRVAETIIVRLGSIKQDLLEIDNIELKYGTNEYYIKLDDMLTQKALNYQE